MSTWIAIGVSLTLLVVIVVVRIVFIGNSVDDYPAEHGDGEL